MTRTSLGLVAVVVLLAGGTAAVSAVGGPPRAAGAKQVELLGATAVCPDVRQLPGVYQTRISVGVGPLPAGRAVTSGAVVRSDLAGPPGTIPVPVTGPGQVVVGLGTTLNENGVVTTARGGLATGLEVEQVFRASGGPYRGLANLRCEAPRRESWFVGASSGVSDSAFLVLANVEDTPATVDVSAFGTSGPVDQRPGQGLTVPPHSRVRLPLDTLAPDRSWLVVRVMSRQGRVVAALRQARTTAGVARGFDYVPRAQPPAPVVVVPGIPQGPGFRGVVIGNPGDDDTIVSVRVTVKDGQFVPQGLDQVAVPAHHSVSLGLSDLAAASPLTVTVTSPGAPVVAGAVLEDVQVGLPRGFHELAYGGSALPLSGPALLTDLAINRPTESTLLLSAPDTAATVVVTPIRVLGSPSAPAPRTLHIPAGRTIAFRLSTFFPPGTQARLAVEVRPEADSGPVYATRYLRERGARGTLSTLLTLQGPAQLVPRPTAVQDDEAGYP